MDRYAKQVYKFVYKQPDHEFLTRMYPDQIPGGIGKLHDFLLATDYLVSEGYAVKIPNVSGISLTHIGIHKREIEFRKFWHSFFSRFIPGVISGVLSTIIAASLLGSLRLPWGI